MSCRIDTRLARAGSTRPSFLIVVSCRFPENPPSARGGNVSRPYHGADRQVSESNVPPETFGQADGGVWRPAPAREAESESYSVPFPSRTVALRRSQ